MDTITLLNQLQIKCEACSGLCCYALYLCIGESFAIEKKAGTPCLHLQSDFRCDCYPSLHQQHMKGCTIYDCFGAGQYVTQVLYKQDTWQSKPSLKTEVCKTFPLVLQLHQILYYLVLATMLQKAQPYKDELQQAIEHVLQLRLHPSAQDITLFQTQANCILKKISKDIHEQYPSAKRHATAIAKNFKGSDLSGYDFTMSTMIAANLTGCNVTNANFLGADMRDVNIANTDMSKALFLTQIQLNSAIGNGNTIIPTHLTIPKNW